MKNLFALFVLLNLFTYCTLSAYIPFVEKEAEFPGGRDSLDNYIRRELGLPDMDMATDTSIFELTISNEGDVWGVFLRKGVNPQLDNSLLTVLLKTPKWTPAKKNGVNIQSKSVVPVAIQLPRDLDAFNKEVITDSVPQYIGTESLLRFISQNIEYPTTVAEEGISGVVMLKLTITKEGDVEDVEVMRKVHPLLDAAAVSAAKKIPKVTPRLKDGLPVESVFLLPVAFKFK